MPGPVSQFTAATTNATSITLTWMVSSNIFVDHFNITYNYTVKGCNIGGTNTMAVISNGSARTHTLRNLSEDSTYRITVTAINNEGSTMAAITADTGTSS